MKVSIAHMSALIVALASQTSAYSCQKNTEDAGRWQDSKNPADRFVELCKRSSNDEAFQAEKGKMIVSGPRDEAFCNFIWGWAGSAQSWHGDWFLWSDITCSGGPGSNLSIRIV